MVSIVLNLVVKFVILCRFPNNVNKYFTVGNVMIIMEVLRMID